MEKSSTLSVTSLEDYIKLGKDGTPYTTLKMPLGYLDLFATIQALVNVSRTALEAQESNSKTLHTQEDVQLLLQAASNLIPIGVSEYLRDLQEERNK